MFGAEKVMESLGHISQKAKWIQKYLVVVYKMIKGSICRGDCEGISPENLNIKEKNPHLYN